MSTPIPAWQLYGEAQPFPDLLHVERIVDRAAGLDWTIAPHRHLALHQLFYLRAGQVVLFLDGARLAPETPVALNLPPGCVHGFSFSAGTDGYVLTLPVKDHPALFDAGQRIGDAARRPAVLAADETVGRVFESLVTAWAGASDFRDIELRALAALAFSRVLDGAGQGAGAADPRLARFEAQIRARLRDGWTVERHAAALNLSARHLNRLCQAATGQSAHARIEAQRLHEACRLLAYTRMSVQEIGWAVGHADPSYFSRSFRRLTGQSPQDYRRGLNG